MAYWSFEHKVSKDDVVHYGRKGMKWGQNIFESEEEKQRGSVYSTKSNKVHRNIMQSNEDYYRKKYGRDYTSNRVLDCMYNAKSKDSSKRGRSSISLKNMDNYENYDGDKKFNEVARTILNDPYSGWSKDPSGLKQIYDEDSEGYLVIENIFGDAIMHGEKPFLYDKSTGHWLEIEYDPKTRSFIAYSYAHDSKREKERPDLSSIKMKDLKK